MTKNNLLNLLTIRSDHTPEDGYDLTTRSYTLRAESYDDKTRSVEAVIASEAMVTVFDWGRGEFLDEILLVSGAKFADQVPYVDRHDLSTIQKMIGSTRDMRIEGDKIIGRNYFAETQLGKDAESLVRGKHLLDNSIGYRVLQSSIIEAGESANINGRAFQARATLPLRISTQWEIRENSACPIGADQAAKNRSVTNKGPSLGEADRTKTRKDTTMDEFKKWLTDRGLEYDKLADNQRSALQKDFDAEIERAMVPVEPEAERAEENTPVVDPVKVSSDAVRAERTRCQTIRKEAVGIPDDVVQRCIDEGMTIDQARKEFLDHMRSTTYSNGVPAVIVREHNVTRGQLEASLLLRSGYDGNKLLKNKNYTEQVLDSARRDIHLLDVCRYVLGMEGKQAPFGKNELVERAFATASLSDILSNVANKSLMQGYEMAPQTWREWCSIGSVSDFKTHTKLRLSLGGGFRKITNHGEVPSGTMENEAETIKADTYAQKFGITRQDIINDDTSAFTQVPQQIGLEANQDLGNLVYETMMANPTMGDGVACFHTTSHGNLVTSNSFGKAGLAAALLAFRKMTNISGRFINIPPAILLVPPDLEEVAMEYMTSDLIMATGHASVSAYTMAPSKNIYKGVLRVVVEPRLSNASYTNYATTTWYVMGDPAMGAKNVEVAFLNGQQTPTITRFVPGVDYVGGIIFQAYFDAGAAPVDFRTMQKNTA